MRFCGHYKLKVKQSRGGSHQEVRLPGLLGFLAFKGGQEETSLAYLQAIPEW